MLLRRVRRSGSRPLRVAWHHVCRLRASESQEWCVRDGACTHVSQLLEPAKAPRTRSTPSAVAKVAQELTHVPFGSGCRYCVQDKAKDDARRKIEEAFFGDLPEIQSVRAFAKTEGDTDMSKLATMRRGQTGAAATFCVRRKGAGDEYVVKGILSARDEWCPTELVFQD